jgi:hypothetical protein
MEESAMYEVRGPVKLFGRWEQFEEFADAAQGAWRHAMRVGAGWVVDPDRPKVPLGQTKRLDNPMHPAEPVIVFEDLRPDAAILARRSLLRFQPEDIALLLVVATEKTGPVDVYDVRYPELVQWASDMPSAATARAERERVIRERWEQELARTDPQRTPPGEQWVDA